jgi:hypothetical protein
MRGGLIRSFTMSWRFPVLVLAVASFVVILRSTPNPAAAQTFGSASGRAKWARDFKGEWSPTGVGGGQKLLLPGEEVSLTKFGAEQ